jgi:aspartyl protease family protein
MQEFPRTLKIVTVWGVIVVLMFLAAQWWLAEQQRPRLSVEPSAGGNVVVIQRMRDGHYLWPGRVGDLEVNFMIDTGATRTSISQDLAQRAGLQNFDTAQFSTANGDVTGGLARSTLRLQGGLTIERHVVAVMPRMDDTALLGMDVLGKLKIEQFDRQLRISFPALPLD